MPKIPVYTPQQTIPATAGGVRVDVGEAGAPGRALMQAGQALQNVGKEMGDLAGVLEWRKQKIEKENDELKVIDTLTKFRSEQRTKLGEFRQLMGENAATGYEGIEKWHTEKAAEYENGLTSDYQRKLWKVRVGAEIDQGLNVASTHASEQRKAWKADTLDAVFQDILVTLDNSRGDDITVQNSKNQMKQTLEALFPDQDMSAYRLQVFSKIDKAAAQAKAKYAETNAFMDVMVRNGNDPEKGMDEWMNPETITKYGLTDLQWRSGALNFDNLVKQRLMKEEQIGAKASQELLRAFEGHTLTFASVEKAFSGIQSEKLKASLMEHWQAKINQQEREIRAERREERSLALQVRSEARMARMELQERKLGELISTLVKDPEKVTTDYIMKLNREGLSNAETMKFLNKEERDAFRDPYFKDAVNKIKVFPFSQDKEKKANSEFAALAEFRQKVSAQGLKGAEVLKVADEIIEKNKVSFMKDIMNYFTPKNTASAQPAKAAPKKRMKIVNGEIVPSGD